MLIPESPKGVGFARRRKKKSLPLRRFSSTSGLIFLHPDGIGLSEGV